jgi:hypothetical protein
LQACAPAIKRSMKVDGKMGNIFKAKAGAQALQQACPTEK